MNSRKSAQVYKFCDVSHNVTSGNTKSPCSGEGHEGAKRIGTAQKTARKLVEKKGISPLTEPLAGTGYMHSG